VAALQEELDAVKASMHRELSAQRGKLGEAEDELAQKENALQQARAALEAMQRKGPWAQFANMVMNMVVWRCGWTCVLACVAALMRRRRVHTCYGMDWIGLDLCLPFSHNSV
jgi:hypothetical protein